ncbi:hypothetical protein [Amycolatopsis thermoflava]|uniref:hypothetical protein n=1 Tax=Amycolatopsis thermoflava TaxID=84480 RepID=UPI00040DE896|nr:hypothetical protein [Amycolatopsis thermoflava]
MADNVDIYPVGLLHDWKHRKIRPLRRALRYPIRQARAGNWRAVSNYFNGYLAEHQTEHCNAGHGWTKRRAHRDLNRHLARKSAPTEEKPRA